MRELQRAPRVRRASHTSDTAPPALASSRRRERGSGFAQLALACALLASGVLACHGGRSPEPEAPVDPAARGRQLFGAYCADCHGPQARGDGPLAASLPKRPADLTQIAARNGDLFIADAVASYIDGRKLVEAHGPREMPVWGRELDDRNASLESEMQLSPDMIESIVTFLRTVQQDTDG